VVESISLNRLQNSTDTRPSVNEDFWNEIAKHETFLAIQFGPANLQTNPGSNGIHMISGMPLVDGTAGGVLAGVEIGGATAELTAFVKSKTVSWLVLFSTISGLSW
jgi:hypothetical protein